VDEARARELLSRERERIERQLADLERRDDDGELSNLDQHPGDAGTELFEEERDAGIARRLREELAAVERAERRLADGTYGVSVESGEPIPDARLEAVPFAERTAEEQERLERSG
jgi:DnaK suppressor protein